MTSKKVNVAVIGGTGLETLLKAPEPILVDTPYGRPPPIFIGKVGKKRVAFLPRHGSNHSVPPHKVNYRANIYALHEIGAERIIATSAVGAINLSFMPGDLTIPHDLIDFTKCRKSTFYDAPPVTHVDLSQPYCPIIRSVLIKIARKNDVRIWDNSVLVCTDGPRYETPAEIKMFRKIGCDIVSMTGAPEAFLARELEMCYAAISFISNVAAGIQVRARLGTSEITEMAKEKAPILEQILTETILNLPNDRCCPCIVALKDARF